MRKQNDSVEYVVIFRPYFTDRQGKRHYPPPGRKAWPLRVRVKR